MTNNNSKKEVGMKSNKYRIVIDKFNGYEAQIKYWWFPFIYWQCNKYGSINTHNSIEDALKFIENHRNKTKIVYEE